MRKRRLIGCFAGHTLMPHCWNVHVSVHKRSLIRAFASRLSCIFYDCAATDRAFGVSKLTRRLHIIGIKEQAVPSSTQVLQIMEGGGVHVHVK